MIPEMIVAPEMQQGAGLAFPDVFMLLKIA